MKVLKNLQTTQAIVHQFHQQKKRVALIPTMGALHLGHIALIKKAKRLANHVIVSIYVNPTQFEPKEDFTQYPRPFKKDVAICRSLGVDLVFAPENLYKKDHSTWVEETYLSQNRCGHSRPNHFRGVCTVVTKLFHLIQPHIAIFGQKDAQQCEIIKKMVRDLNFPIKIIVVPTIREKDGLAMSSRNQYLTHSQRKLAPRLYSILTHAARMKKKASQVSTELTQGGFQVDYVEQVNNRLCAAVWLGQTRLIDNVKVT